MSAGPYDIIIEQNATFELDLYWKTSAIPAVPINVTGYTGKMQIRSAMGGTLLYTLTTANTGIRMGTTDGHIQLYIADTVTNAFTWTTGVYDLDITAPITLFTTRVLQGNVTIVPAVTTI